MNAEDTHAAGDGGNNSDGSATSPEAAAASDSGIEAIKQLREDLRLEITPQRLLRQYSVNVPPRCASEIEAAGGLHASPGVVENMLERWEKNKERWRRMGSNDSLVGIDQQQQQQQRLDAQTPEDSLSSSRRSSLSTAPPGSDSASLSSAPPARRRSSLFRNNEIFEVTFGHGFLGLEFVIDEAQREVVVRHVQDGSWSDSILSIPHGATLMRGLTVEAVNGNSIGAFSPQQILGLLQHSPRPMTVRFRRSTKAVVCKLCECKVDAFRLNEHTDYCVMSKRFELQADVINASLTSLVTSINANLASEPVRPFFHDEDVHFYHTLRVVAIQAASCDVSSIDSFALCCRLIKIVDRTRDHEHETTSFVAERGLKYCARIRNLIHAKMSKMRSTHKVMFQQDPYEIVRAPLQRTKSLEQLEISARPLLAAGTVAPARPKVYRVSIRDFRIVKPISKGAFGKVYLARKKTTGDQYAIKVLAKEHLQRKKQIRQIETERNILAHVESPFVVKLFWTFQTRQNLFLVMEYLPGGDFMSLLECIVQLEEQVARVYIAEIAIALHHLHLKGCVHRDLKPDNILISSTGHIKLTDFGLSESALSGLEMTDGFVSDDPMSETHSIAAVSPPSSSRAMSVDESDSLEHDTMREEWSAEMSSPPTEQATRSSRSSTQQSRQTHHTNGRCGTPDYLSPEIILGRPHGPAVDYWALGVILYEMLVGFPPFNDDTVEAIFNNIRERNILWPDGEKCITHDAMDLIDRLLDCNPETRLGWEGVVAHPFFRSIDWDTLLETVPPFVPTLEGPNDTSYFNNRNLTDIFIDDDEFELDSQSFDSSSSPLPGNSSGVVIDERQQDGEQAKPLPMQASSAVSSTGGETPGVTDSEVSVKGIDAAARGPQSVTDDQAEDSPAFDAFRSFSYTNMNALVAASRSEAELVADAELNSAELSILI